ncbi:putative uncharacterized protein DDB_G0289263 [Chelonus insularis]|uniref:putative uncharacterized protein DDB_G0289263 n=1 Tax=Chelonus insularis TaxID=460826 RepID=UPI00158AF1BA|nr:putative uncharacterized protein DDB_G0289263 [Chelonus insularis]
MTSQMIWLLGYVSLGLALTLGNRPSIHNHAQIRSGFDNRLRTNDQTINEKASIVAKKSSDSDSSYHYGPYDLPPDWNIYQDHARSAVPDDNNNNGINNPRGYSDTILNDFSNTVLESIDSHRDLLNTQGQVNINNEESDNIGDDDDDDDDDDDEARIHNSRHSQSQQSSERILRSEALNQNDLTNQYSLNERLIDSQNSLASTSHKSSFLWSPEPFGYPWKIQPNVDTRSPLGNFYTSRTLGKRNQVAGTRRKSVDSRTTSQQGQHPSSFTSGIPEVSMGSMASQLMLRSARGNRQYDVPQIECPSSEDGMERFACPTPDRMGRYRCIDDHVLCDGFIDCPTGEDEDRQACMFYKTTKAHLDVLAEALLRWVRGR